MQLSDILAPEDVCLLTSADKRDALRALSVRAATRLDLDVAAILDRLMQREALGSTGIGAGIALPHARIDTLGHVHGLFAVLSRPVEFGAIDDTPVDLVFLLLLPAQAPDTHLKPLACVARRFRTPGLADRLRQARDPGDIYGLLVDAPRPALPVRRA